MQEPIRVLHVFGRLSLGGAESRVMDLYRHMDREKLQFDFLVHSAGEEYFDKEIKELGGRIYRVPRFKFYNWLEYRKALKSFFFEHSEFRAVHGHMTSTASIYLPIAKKAGIPITIAHARSAGVDAGIKGILIRWLRRSLNNKADYCLACSKEAGEAVFGKKCMCRGRVEVIPNAIAAPQYVYSPEIRRCMRQELQVEDKLVIGHVGSFRPPKNHVFLLKIFGEIRRRREDAVLLLLGEGGLQEKIKELAESEGLKESVFFLGNRSPVSDYYQAMDFLVFPSIFEGLPGAIIEAQTSGLRCLISDVISEEVKITDLVNSYSLEHSAAEWAEYVLANCEYERQSRLEEVSAAGFDIDTQVKKYEKVYKVC